MADIVFVNPKFEPSYWGLEHALPLFGKKANLPVACLPLLAALTPEEHRVTLLDENVAELDFDRLARADIVGLTGMNVQRERMLEILKELRRRGAFVVIGGPWVSVHENYFDGLCDVIFVGEAEEAWPEFLRDYEKGEWKKRYEQANRTDMTKVPPPRYDLLEMKHYLFGSIQFSRGCPFQCEFCDIIVTFGRRPRLKTTAQVLVELDLMKKHGLEIAFIVDDNLIGNKKQIKEVLREVAAWQERHGFPLTFFTEASLDLADDEELMQLMVDANIQTVFIGIESPNEKALRETKKFQNVRTGGTIIEKIHRVQNAGLDVWCGMIMGFDSDDDTIFAAQREFLSDARILHAMVGMLHAIPKTPLYDRLKAEGRLDEADRSEYGTNVIPLQMSREDLRRGYVKVMRELYEPEAYFERLEALFIKGKFRFGMTHKEHLRRHPLRRLKSNARHLLFSAGLFLRLMRRVPQPELRAEYRKRVLKLLRHNRDPAVLFVYVLKCAIHFHHYTIAMGMTEGKTAVVSSFG